MTEFETKYIKTFINYTFILYLRYIDIYISFGPVITARPKTFSHQSKQKVLFYKI